MEGNDFFHKNCNGRETKTEGRVYLGQFYGTSDYLIDFKFRKKSTKSLKIKNVRGGANLYTPSTLNIDFIQWHTQLNVCAVK